MNKQRRKLVDKILQTAIDDLSDVVAEEEEAMDNMPESLQDSDRYAAMEEARDFLSDAVDAIEDLRSSWSSF